MKDHGPWTPGPRRRKSSPGAKFHPRGPVALNDLYFYNTKDARMDQIMQILNKNIKIIHICLLSLKLSAMNNHFTWLGSKATPNN